MRADGVIVMQGNTDADFIHEAAHGYQHLVGEIELIQGGEKKAKYVDLGDERRAYQRQYMFKPSSVTGLRGKHSIHDFLDITDSWVESLKDRNGKTPYEGSSYENLRKR
ncbi:MAG: hypothetical protein JJU02_09190 [Cryomorphaceae bacterium]|nr:hypothetical protein [Cryomorphaceae bacterium]